MAHVAVPHSFFKKEVMSYADWESAYFREAIQNSLDAGATKIDISVDKEEDFTVIRVVDNGCGMDSSVLDKFLTLGGSEKSENSVGGFGYAKTLLAFCHDRWRVSTQDLVVHGTGGEYTISNSFYRQGCSLKAWTTGKVEYLVEGFHSFCKNFSPKEGVSISFNHKKVVFQETDYKYSVATEIGKLSFNEGQGTGTSLWIRVKGIPMFSTYISSFPEGFHGILELEGNTLDLLTTNRDGLRSEKQRILQRIIEDLRKRLEQICNDSILDFTINEVSNIYLDSDKKFRETSMYLDSQYVESVPNLLQVFKEKMLEYSKKKEKEKSLFDKINKKAYLPNSVISIDKSFETELGDVLKNINSLKTQKLAFIWNTLVSIIKDNWYYNNIKTGLVFNKSCIGLNAEKDGKYCIYINPTLVEEYSVDDLLDVAIHEMAHIDERCHNETFIHRADDLRRNLRKVLPVNLAKHCQQKWIRFREECR